MSTAQKTAQATHHAAAKYGSRGFLGLLNPYHLYVFVLQILYIIIQRIIIAVFKPKLPTWEQRGIKPKGRVAIVGAGLTGISSAAHAASHGFDVVIYEASNKPGGIWANVNQTSGLQLNSLLYRFHPGVHWSTAFPHRDEIVGEIKKVWQEYGLVDKTRFDTPVTSIRKAEDSGHDDSDFDEHDDEVPAKSSRWVVNDGEDGIFDAVIVTVGTCGKPKWVKLDGMPANYESQNLGSASPSQDKEPDETGDSDTFAGTILHSSQLDSMPSELIEGKKVVVIGGGASAVEAVETALERGGKAEVVMRHLKWIIPRNIVFDTLIAAQPFGREMPLSFIWEKWLALTHYRGVKELVPKTGIFEGTPIVNDEFLPHIRDGKTVYHPGNPIRLTKKGVLIEDYNNNKAEKEIDADVIVFATGFYKPKIDFLPKDLFPKGYARPNLYLQNFSTEDWSILLTNSSYVNAIGTVGHFHIGIYTRILLTFLMDEGARPVTHDMKLWVDMIRFIKRGARGGALGFFTYMELTIWLLGFLIVRPDRLRWMFFILNGFGSYP